MPERLDELHVSLPEHTAWFDVDGHLTLVAAFALVDPSQVHHHVHGLVREFRGKFDIGAIEGSEGQRARTPDPLAVFQIVGNRSVSEIWFVTGMGSLPVASSGRGRSGTEILPRRNQPPRRSRTSQSTRLAGEATLAGSEETISSSSRLEVLGAPVHRKGPDILQREVGRELADAPTARFLCCVR